ncbi:MAG: hypothetical protein D6776_00735, partial [Planctomycetota bacterium]
MSTPKIPKPPASAHRVFEGRLGPPLPFSRRPFDPSEVAERSHERARIRSARWDRHEALVGEEVKLICELEGPPAREVTFTIFEHDADGQHDSVRRERVPARGSTVELVWKVENVGDLDDVDSEQQLADKGYTLPEFHFFAAVPGSVRDSGLEEGDLLKVRDVLDIAVHDGLLEDEPAAGLPYVVTFADGRQVEGTVGEDGRIRVEDVPPGRFWLRIRGKTPEPFEGEPAEPAEVGEPPAWIRPLEGERDPPRLAFAEPCWIARVWVEPPVAAEGQSVTLHAAGEALPADAPAVFRIYRLGEGGGPVAEIPAQVSGDTARARWSVSGARGGGQLDGRPYADFDVAFEIGGELWHTPGLPELRAF